MRAVRRGKFRRWHSFIKLSSAALRGGDSIDFFGPENLSENVSQNLPENLSENLSQSLLSEIGLRPTID